MKKYCLIILLLGNLLTGKLLFAQNLGDNQGDYLEIASRAGYTNNDFKNKLWLYRWINGSGWTSAALFDGISIDGSCLIPKVDARTWWQRDPAGEIQSWGTRNQTYMTLNGPKLGIGTTDPQVPLDIQSTQNGWMINSRVIAGAIGEINGIKFYSGYLGEDKWAGIASVTEDLYSNATGFSIYTNQSEKLRVTADGKVGIGATLPESKLRVVGGGVVIGRNATANDTDGNLSIGDISMNSSPNPSTWTYGTNMLISGLDFTTIGFHDAGERVDFIRSGKGTIELGYDGGWGHANIALPNGVWNAAGNLGIGTITPSATLEVLGTAKFGGQNANLDIAGNLPVYQNLSGTGKMLIGWNRTAGAGETDFVANEGGGSEGGFAFYSYNNASLEKQLLRVLGNGDVGIGTSTPREKLSVNGNIRAHEIKVEPTHWPDYVFSKDYKIGTLNELEAYIKTNKHLPEIPSAEVIEKEGLALGEMNKKLLKNLEELTLHVIEQNKQLMKQNLRIAELEKKMGAK
jgi:hypothetical protein